MEAGNLKMTQSEINGGDRERGIARQVYVKPSTEKRAKEYCKKENMSFSLLIRIALEEFLEKRGV